MLFQKVELTSVKNENSTDDAANTKHVTSIKLFGRTVSLTNNHKSMKIEEKIDSVICKDSPCPVDSGFDSSLPCWNLRVSLPDLDLGLRNEIVNLAQIHPFLKEGTTKKEIHCNESNAESDIKMGKVDKLDGIDSQCQSSRHKGGVSSKSPQGFVPYKRCLTERGVNEFVDGLEERKGQRTRVCS